MKRKKELLSIAVLGLMAASAPLVVQEVEKRTSGRPEAHIYQKFRGTECEVCGKTTDLEWAHAYPYSLSKGTDKEYLITSPTNGCTLCDGKGGGCHLRVGHYGNYSKYWNARLIPIVKDLHDARMEMKKDFNEKSSSK